MSGQTALILGATGATGKLLLKELLNSPNFTKIGEFGRRVSPLDGLPNREKLSQKVIDFEKVHEAGLNQDKWDVVFIAMGTTRAQAGGIANFRKIDQDYVVNAAQAARSSGHNQRLVYLSVRSASTSSMFPYLQSKGETEIRLASLGYQDNIIVQPRFIYLQREETRLLESVGMQFAKLASRFTDDACIPVESLARAIRITGELGTSNLPKIAQATREQVQGASFTVVPNAGLLALSSSQSS